MRSTLALFAKYAIIAAGSRQQAAGSRRWCLRRLKSSFSIPAIQKTHQNNQTQQKFLRIGARVFTRLCVLLGQAYAPGFFCCTRGMVEYRVD